MLTSCKYNSIIPSYAAACGRAKKSALHVLACALIFFALAGAGRAERVRLMDGAIIEADDAWEDAQGVWYRQGGITRLIERSRVRLIERTARAKESSNAPHDAELKLTTATIKASATDAPTSASLIAPAPQSVWIYLVGGARVEADEITETPTGAWSRRGNVSIFFERARIERIEREPRPLAVAEDSQRAAWRARGWSTGNARLDELIKLNGARASVDPYLIFCVMEQESHFNARAVSPVGARGLMQLMPGTGARFGVRRFFDPAENIAGGTRYLKQLLAQFGGRVELVLASYNAGEGAVIKYGGRVPPYRETRNYVQRISARYKQNQMPPREIVAPAITTEVHAVTTAARLQ